MPASLADSAGRAPTQADLDRLAAALVDLLIAAWRRRQVEAGSRPATDRTEAA